MSAAPKRAIDKSPAEISASVGSDLKAPLEEKLGKYKTVGAKEQQDKIIKELNGLESFAGKMALKAAVSGGAALKALNTPDKRAGSIAKLLNNDGKGLSIMKDKAQASKETEKLNDLLGKLFSGAPFTQDDLVSFMKFSPASKDFK